MNGWLTDKRKTILVNAVFFGIVAGAAAISQAVLTGTQPSVELLVLAGGAALGGFVGYINSKQADIETGAKAPGVARKTRTKIGL